MHSIKLLIQYKWQNTYSTTDVYIRKRISYDEMEGGGTGGKNTNEHTYTRDYLYTVYGST